jgi:hypothetical protein
MELKNGSLVFINFQNCFIQSIIELDQVSSIVNIENKYFDKHLVENISVPVPVKYPVPVTIPVPLTIPVPAKSWSRHFLPIPVPVPVPAEKAIPVDPWFKVYITALGHVYVKFVK